MASEQNSAVMPPSESLQNPSAWTSVDNSGGRGRAHRTVASEGRECVTLDDRCAPDEGENFVRLGDASPTTSGRGRKPPEGCPGHGFSSPCFVWNRTMPALTQAGFRVLRLDLYGAGCRTA